MNTENKDLFIWDDLVCADNTVVVKSDIFELNVSNGGYLYLLNRQNGERGILRKELINNGAFSRPKLFAKGGFTVIWKTEVCDELANVVGTTRGFSIEPDKKDKEAFDKLEGLARILYHNKIRITF